MDVRCARCGIEYEFDDALISDRGTMVRCTECGHQFRVHPSHVIPGAPDEWRIVTPDGQTIVYLTLRELQQGITQGHVGRDANLIRGSGPARPLGTIAELDPFFPTPAGEQRQQSTLTGVAPPSLAPTEPKPTPNGPRAPIARIGLNTVQVSASGVGLEPPRLVNRPRKTTLGMGDDPHKLQEVAARAKEAALETGAMHPPPGLEKTEIDAPVAETPGNGEARTAAPLTPAVHQSPIARPPVPPSATELAPETTAPKVETLQEKPPAGMNPSVAAPSAHGSTDLPGAQGTEAVPPAADSPKRTPGPSAKTSVPKQGPSVPLTSEPPTLRNTDADEMPIAQKRSASSPPRPERRNTPTPGTRLAAVTQAAAAERAAALPLTVKAPSKPPTEPPPAQRTTRDELRFKVTSEPPGLQPVGSATIDQEPPPRSKEILPPPVDAPSEPAEESAALVFQAESPPIEHPPEGTQPPDVGRATPAVSDEPEPGSFMPTVPPKRLLTNADGSLSRETRARGSRMGRWLLAGLFVVLLSLVALWFNSQSPVPSGSPAAPLATTLEQYLSSASDALIAGDLVRAHDQLQSSQTTGGRDPRWMALTARYDVMRADMNWLALRLADPSDTARTEALAHELADHVAQASRALTSIERLSLKDPQLDAAKVDAQRLRGELDAARAAARALRRPEPSAELAYTLAAAELLAEAPNYGEVFEWLGRARAADAGLGRAPALLVFACVMSQRVECAQAELARLKAAPKSHPLLPEIEAFVKRTSAVAAPAEQDAAVAEAIAAVPDAGAVPTNTLVAEPANNELAGDFRLRLRRGAESLSRNELTRAEQLFRSVLAERPTDTEALTGMGDIARRRNNLTNAVSYYQKVLASNGQYLPALSALADVKWRSGDRAGAAPLYRRILDQVGESAGYGQVAAQRLRELSEGSAKPTSSAETEKGAAPAGSLPSGATHRTGNRP